MFRELNRVTKIPNPFRESPAVEFGQAIVGPLPDAAMQPPGQLGFCMLV